jgi:flagellar protein FlgJ
MKSADLTGKVAFDANSLNALKMASKENSPETIKEVAKQFEAVFMNMMLKSMREATPQENPFDNEQSRTFTSMLDQQLSSNLAAKGLGLADILAKQLSKGVNVTDNTLDQAVSDPTKATESNINEINTTPPKASFIQSYLSQQPNANIPAHLVSATTISDADKSNKANSAQEKLADKNLSTNGLINLEKVTNDKKSSKSKATTAPTSNSTEFKNRMSAHAEEASRTTGIPSKLMLGQAALESGWGKREIKDKDGTPSYNLFGIKANANWKGKVVETVTTEYVNGVKQKHVTKFRAYDSYADSFKDFAKLMQNNPRYQGVMSNLHDHNSYAEAMQKAGYATDPNYANKLASVIQKVSSA